MLLLHMIERRYQRSEGGAGIALLDKREISMATEHELPVAIGRLKAYCARYANHFKQSRLVVDFTLLTVSEIQKLSDDDLEFMNVEDLDNLSTFDENR